MQQIKNARLRAKCQQALSDDNIEMCLQELSGWFPEEQEIINQRGRISALKKEKRNGTIAPADYRLERNSIRVSLNEFIDENILPEGEDEILEGIHNRILVVACKNSPTDWDNLFPEAFFSHVHIMRYGEEVPPAFSSPDVVIFDDLDCPGIGNDAQVRMLAHSMPNANLLYYGQYGENPFKKVKSSASDKEKEENTAFAERCANANSKFTLHARLRELLEFRKIYGTP